MDKLIISFLEENKAFSIAVSENNKPYSAILFYAFYYDNYSLIFASKKETKHSQVALINKFVSGTILSTDLSVANMQGVQITGIVKQLEAKTGNEKINRYKTKFPFALFSPSHLFWELEIETLKMTNNKLGFGKKILWERNSKIPN